MMATVPDTQPVSLDPSELGTKEYWEDLYTKDLSTHAHTPAHIGQVWFDESGAEDRTIAFLEGDEGSGLDPTRATVLDLGTGNGSMLLRLRDEGWEGDLWGVDYSPASVRLARRIVGAWGLQQLAGEELDGDYVDGVASAAAAVDGKTVDFDDAVEPALGIHIIQHDILAPWPPATTDSDVAPPATFDLVHDKGTFDAISLSSEASEACRTYRRRVEAMIRPGGLLLITSCNWTEEELERWMGGDNSLLRGVGRVRYSTFTFGGKEGSELAGLCWRRAENE